MWSEIRSGEAIAFALAVRHPERVDRLVLMGAVGVPFPITPGLDAVWGYEPSFENMRKLLDIFAYEFAHPARVDRAL